MKSKRVGSRFLAAGVVGFVLWINAPNNQFGWVRSTPEPQRKSNVRTLPPPPPFLPFTAEDLHFRFWYPTSGWEVLPASGNTLVQVTNRAGGSFAVLHSTLEFPLNLDELGNEFIEVEGDVLKKDFRNAQIRPGKFITFHKLKAIEFQYDYTSNFGPQSGKEVVIIRDRELIRLRISWLQSAAASTELLVSWMLDNLYFYQSLAAAPTLPTPMPFGVATTTPPAVITRPAPTVVPSPPALAAPSASNAETFYQQARSEYLKFSFSSAGKAVQLFQKAISADHAFALAFAGQAEALGWRVTLLQTHAIPAESGENRAALDLAQQASKLGRDHVAVQRSLALAYFINDDEKNADKALKKARQLNPADAETNLVTAETHLEDPEQLLSDCQAALGINPSLVGALYLQGLALLKLDRKAEALESFNKVIRLSPEFAEAFYERGQLLAQLSQNDEALSSFQKAVSFNNKLVAAQFKLAILLQQLKRFDEAIEQYKATLQANPYLPQPYYNLGAIFADEKKDSAQAAVYFKKFLELTKDEAKAEQVRMWLQMNPQ